MAALSSRFLRSRAFWLFVKKGAARGWGSSAAFILARGEVSTAGLGPGKSAGNVPRLAHRSSWCLWLFTHAWRCAARPRCVCVSAGDLVALTVNGMTWLASVRKPRSVSCSASWPDSPS